MGLLAFSSNEPTTPNERLLQLLDILPGSPHSPTRSLDPAMKWHNTQAARPNQHGTPAAVVPTHTGCVWHHKQEREPGHAQKA